MMIPAIPVLTKAKTAFALLTDGQQRKYRYSLLFMFFNSIVELCSFGLLIPFFALIVSPSKLFHNTLLQTVYNTFHFHSFEEMMLVLGILVFTGFSFKNWMSYFLYSYYNSYAFEVATSISERMLRRYYSLPLVDVQLLRTGGKLHDIAYIPIEFGQHIVLGSITIISELAILAMFTAGLLFFEFQVSILVFATLAPFTWFAWRTSRRVLQETRKTIQNISPLNMTTLSDALDGYQESVLHGVEPYFLHRYLEGQSRLNRQLAKLNASNIIPSRFSEVFAIAGALLLLLFYYETTKEFTLSMVTTLTLFVTFAYRAIPSVTRILNAAVHIHTYLFTINTVPPQEPFLESGIGAASHDEAASIHFKFSIEAQNISFSYPDRRLPLLRDVSITIRKGEVIGITGRSGAGKTTLVRIIMQLLPQQEGALFADQMKVEENTLRAWKDLFSYTPQDFPVISGSLLENVAYGFSPQTIDDRKVISALNGAGLTDLLDELPLGLDAVMGENGKTLSGGQKERLGIARALYRDSDIFIFDEPTSELDAVSETGILETMLSLKRRGKTIIIVSHKPSTLSICNRVYTVKKGKVSITKKSGHTRKRRKNI